MNNPVKNFRLKFESLKKTLPKDVSTLALKHFDLNFRKQGFDGDKWKPVKRWQIGKGVDKTRAILSGRTKLLAKSNYVKKASWDKIIIANSAKSKNGYNYGLAHNNGTNKIPQRKFLGNSQVLNKKIVNFVSNQLNKVFK